jgi:glyceraldehyde 3-phosphate dehydrogenase
MMDRKIANMRLGINGLGRIGKLTLWHHVGRKAFDEIVVNTGRKIGGSLEDLAHYIERDSTYGSLHTFLHGYRATPVIADIDEEAGTMMIDGVKVTFLTKARNPKDIQWSEKGVRLVVDATGTFLDPTVPPDAPTGSCLGHLEAGAEKVVVSAPFKIKDKSRSMPDNAVTTVMGVNHNDYDPRRHKVISAASCTTTCLAHMVKPLLDHFGAKKILTASMATIHAATGSQAVLDLAPKSGATDLRKTRSIMNNIILTSTGAANTLGLVIPEMKQIGFIAESVRIPTSTGSLVILVVNLQDDPAGPGIRRDMINGLYRGAAEADLNHYLHYSDRQNVSTDIAGHPRAAAIIEGHETHTRTAEININLAGVCGDQPRIVEGGDIMLRILVTQAVIYGWYDNEFAGYVNMLGDRTVSIAEMM